MNILHYRDPVRFQVDTRDYLLRNEAENNLPLGILASIISGEYLEKDPYLALIVQGGEPILVVICTPPFPVLFSYQERPLKPIYVRQVIEDLIKELGPDFTGMSGDKKLLASPVEQYSLITGQQPIHKMAMRIYKLEQVIPVSGIPGKMRPAEKQDNDMLLEWYANFHRDGLGEEPDPEQVQRQVSRYQEANPHQRGLMIWEDSGTPVSMAGYAGPTLNGIRIGAVYTPPDCRRNGYASACTAGLSQHLLELGFKFCFLFTDLRNPTSNHIYQQIGYQAVCDVDRYDFS